MRYFETIQGNWPLEEVVRVIERSAERYNVNVTYPEYILAGQFIEHFNTGIYVEITDYVRNFADRSEQLIQPYEVRSELKGIHLTYMAVKRFIGVKIDLYPYFGGAHSDHDILTITFDTNANAMIALSDFFVVGSNYLERLSTLTEKALFENYPELEFAFNDPVFREGFAAKEENFNHWVLTNRGLMIFFPEYQVAPYAAGTLVIEIPYIAIVDIIVSNR